MRARRLAAALTLAALLGLTALLSGCGSSTPSADAPVTVNIVVPGPAPSTNGTVTQPGAPSRATTTGSGANITVTVPRAAAAPTVSPAASNSVSDIDTHLKGVSVWVPYWDSGAGMNSATQNAGTVQVAHPFWFEITGASTVVNQVGDAQAALIAELRAKGERVIPTVTETANQDSFAKILANPSKRAAMISALEYVADLSGVDGVDLDFENMAVGSGDMAAANTVATDFPQMVSTLCGDLHASGRVCEVTVPARNEAVSPSASAFDTGIYDYAALGSVADRVQLMAYDDHVPSGAAGPIAPMPWVESVVNYSRTQIPVAKLVLGIPAYGYDWSSKGGGTSLTAPAAVALAGAKHARIMWDPAADEPTFTYRDGKVRHTVWYENGEAGYLRAALAGQDDLAGVALWAGGDEDPQLWADLAKLR